MSSSGGGGRKGPKPGPSPVIPLNFPSRRNVTNATPPQSQVTSAAPDSTQPTPEEAQKIRWEEEASTLHTPSQEDQTWAVNERSQRTAVLTNSFKFTLDATKELFRYTIILGSINDPKPQEKGSIAGKKTEKKVERHLSLATKRYLITKLLEQHRPTATDYACDFRDTIISVGPLYEDFKSGEKDVPHTRTGDNVKPVQSKIRYNGRLEIARLNQFVLGQDVGKIKKPGMEKELPWTPDEELKALNIISWKFINSPKYEGGRVGKKFYPQSLLDDDMEQGKEHRKFLIRKGFFTSMRAGKGSVIFNINTTTSAFFSPIPLVTWMSLKWNMWDHKQKKLVAYMPSSNEFTAELRDIRVTFDPDDSKRKWRIFDISPKSIRDTSFYPRKKDGTIDKSQKKKVLDHLTKKWENLRGEELNTSLSCINVGNPDHEIWLPIDRVTIADWQPLTRKLEPEDSNDKMVKIATRPPGENMTLIQDALGNLGFLLKDDENAFYEKFGLSTNRQFIELRPGQCLSTEIQYYDKTVKAEGGKWGLEKLKFVKPAANKSTIDVISLAGDCYAADVAKLLSNLNSYGAFDNSKAIFRTATINGLRDYSAAFRQDCIKQLDTALKSLKTQFKVKSQPEIILVIIPKKGVKFYGAVKRWGDCIVGIPTVCLVGTQNKWKIFCGSGYDANLCLKYNIKLAGVNHQLAPQRNRQGNVWEGLGGAPTNTMIMGADVTHPGREAGDCPSMAAIVASNDNSSGHYLASARLQPSKQEHISDLKSMVKERLIAWVDNAVANKRAEYLPTSILFYRDGVSESQYGMVKAEEFPQIKEGCTMALVELAENDPELYDNINPDSKDPRNWSWPVTMVVVTKRHHTRFYPKSVNLQNKNLTCGKIFDSEVVTPKYDDFYLQSHDSPLGTARGSHYVVIVNNNDKITTPALQDITNRLCYTGCRSPTAISICTPARYADYVCDRLRHYMRPALQKGYTVQKANAAESATPDDFAKDQTIWQCTRPYDENPWHKNLDSIMFYI